MSVVAATVAAENHRQPRPGRVVPATAQGSSMARRPAWRLTFDILPVTTSMARRPWRPGPSIESISWIPMAAWTAAAITNDFTTVFRQSRSSGSTRQAIASTRNAANVRNTSVNPAVTLTATASDPTQLARYAVAASSSGSRRTDVSSCFATAGTVRASGTAASSMADSTSSRGSWETS